MAREKVMGVSPITNKIYYGVQNKDKNEWVGEKVDVTDTAIAAVFNWFINEFKNRKLDDSKQFTLSYSGIDYELVMRKKGSNEE